MMIRQIPFPALTGGFVQPGEMIEAKIDRTDPQSGSRHRVWSRRIYLGVNENDHVVIQHAGTKQVTTLFLNRLKKVR
jgi:hypothetical protein